VKFWFYEGCDKKTKDVRNTPTLLLCVNCVLVKTVESVYCRKKQCGQIVTRKA